MIDKITIKTKNDHKDKLWEAWIEINDGWDEGLYSASFNGYGETEKMAKYHCKNAIWNFIGLLKEDGIIESRENEWQLCPKCNGEGAVWMPSSTVKQDCNLCNGKKIISKIDGNPPK